MILYFIPFEQLGEFKIGSRISNYTKKYSFDFLPRDKEYQSEHYSLRKPDITLHVDGKGTIESIATDEECLYRGRNLIGMDIDEFISHTGEIYHGEIDELNFEDDDVPQFVYEFEDIGLQVWVKNNVVVTIIASSNTEEEED